MQSVIEGVTEELNSLKFLNDYNNELNDRISELQEEINESLDESQIDEILEYIENETIKVDEELERWLEKFRYANGEEKNLGLDAEEITETSSFMDDLDMSSMEIYAFIGDLEAEIHISIPQRVLNNAATVEELANEILDLM